MTLKMISFLIITLRLMRLWNVSFLTTKFAGISDTGIVINLLEEPQGDAGLNSFSNSKIKMSSVLSPDGLYDYKKNHEKETFRKRD